MIKNDIIRVEFRPDVEWQIAVTTFDVDPSYYELDSWYKTVDNMPKWIQDKLRKLQIMIPPPPVNVVPGIGQRVGVNTYWVYPD
jgi:hypothetical protein